MAYALVEAPTHATLPQVIADFAVNTAGWTSAGVNRIAHAGMDAGLSFQFENVTALTPYDQQQVVSLLNGETVLKRAISPAPHVMFTTQNPSRVYLFGGQSPQPFVAAVVEYDPGYYRHIYAGMAERLGNWTGGEIVAGSTHVSRTFSIMGYGDDDHQYLFGGVQSRWGDADAGGVRINHDDLGGEIIAPFRAQTNRNSTAALYENAVLGGFVSNTNDQQIARGNNTFAGVQILVPVNLNLTRPEGRVTPIGRPAGVRMVNMTNLDPAEQLVVGDKTWRCFPQFRKSDASVVPTSGSGMTTEKSFIIGYAYLEG